jgi:hypothetical protein
MIDFPLNNSFKNIRHNEEQSMVNNIILNKAYGIYFLILGTYSKQKTIHSLT